MSCPPLQLEEADVIRSRVAPCGPPPVHPGPPSPARRSAYRHRQHGHDGAMIEAGREHRRLRMIIAGQHRQVVIGTSVSGSHHHAAMGERGGIDDLERRRKANHARIALLTQQMRRQERDAGPQQVVSRRKQRGNHTAEEPGHHHALIRLTAGYRPRRSHSLQRPAACTSLFHRLSPYQANNACALAGHLASELVRILPPGHRERVQSEGHERQLSPPATLGYGAQEWRSRVPPTHARSAPRSPPPRSAPALG